MPLTVIHRCPPLAFQLAGIYSENVSVHNAVTEPPQKSVLQHTFRIFYEKTLYSPPLPLLYGGYRRRSNVRFIFRVHEASV
jgi:hypothetical protein